MGNSESNSRVQVLMNGCGCKESCTASDEAEKKEDKLLQTMLECMKAHSDYYHPYLAAMKAGAAQFHVSPQASKILEGGACKELYRAWWDCAEKDSPRCFAMMWKCILEDHSDHYRDLLVVSKAGVNLFLKELEASLPNKGDKFHVRYYQYLKGGPCKESYTAWSDSVRRSWKQASLSDRIWVNFKAFFL